MKTYKDGFLNLFFKVKSFVTILLTLAFIYQIVANSITQEFMMVYSTVIGFYFGTQSKKDNNTQG